MPAYHLAEAPQVLSRYDVVGQYGDPQTPFVTHVGLFDSDQQELRWASKVDSVHMKPPLTRDRTVVGHVAGKVPLTNDEIKQVEVWIEETEDEYGDPETRDSKRKQYIIHPHASAVRDPNTGALRYNRYSCSGFVLEGHRQVGIKILETDVQLLPLVDAKSIELAYRVGSTRSFAEFGLKGGGPWPIVLPGYILHSMNRSEEEIREIPYRAKSGDEHF